MKFSTLFFTSLTSLISNKIRSLLTISGIVIGVFAIITLVSLVKGLENYVVGEFESLGSNLVFVYPGSGGLRNDPALAFLNNKLSQRHVDLIKREASDVIKSVEPMYQSGGVVKFKNTEYKAAILAGNSKIQDLFALPLKEGRFMSEAETRNNANVAILGHLVKEELFGQIYPIGKTIMLEGKPFEVIGFLEQKGPEYDPAIIVPLKKGEEISGIKNYTYILIELLNNENVYLDTRKIELALLQDLTIDDFTIYSAEDLLSSVREILDILKIGLAAVAGISLLVGGIGIMNIMLVAVSERTSEIGLRKAIGATEKDITLQFLLESSLLSSFGGLLGLGLGAAACVIARTWIPSEITPEMALLAVGFSLCVGILFGTYPAIQASKMDAIEALRYE
ncbi:MAG TPA: ABC transporter permease [bacterium]|nr:ABC transporter permease [bacterium]